MTTPAEQSASLHRHTGPPPVGDVALVHDYLNQRGGAERVVADLAGLFPGAAIYTSLHRAGSTWPEIDVLKIRTSPLQRLPVNERFRALFPLFPLAFRSFGELDADLVLSSSSGWAHGVRTSARALHVVYCYTPARWLYVRAHPLSTGQRLAVAPLLGALREWDRAAAARADRYVAISDFIAERIRDVYGIDAPVVHPPVNTARFTPTPRGERLLVVSRLLNYKRIDLIVETATRARIGLDVVGSGPALDMLRSIAGPTVTFHGAVDDATVAELMQDCRALVCAAVEDFGLALVEAQAAGKPVVAYGAGGALETVVDGTSGTFFSRRDPEAVLDAITRCDRLDADPAALAAGAQRFSRDVFRERLYAVLRGFQDERAA
jgi:glycosyltransferase involved in cell wall biosynthesis